MKTIIALFVVCSVAVSGIGQDINMSFSANGAATTIDSVTATNLMTDQSVILPGSATLVLTFNTGIPLSSGLTDAVRIFPNPFSGVTTLTAIISKKQTIQIRIRNLLGQIISQSQTDVGPGQHEFDLKIGQPGLYAVSLSSDQEPRSYKVLCTNGPEGENQIRYKGMSSPHKGNLTVSGLKAGQSPYSLGYSVGDVILYRCRSGILTSIIADSPTVDKNYEVEFIICSDPDGENYPIVKIGNQYWMAENLAYLPSVSSPESLSRTENRFYVYGYQGNSVNTAKASANYLKYGVLYNWMAAMNGFSYSSTIPSGVQGICPTGWHLPSEGEWQILEKYLGMSMSEVEEFFYRSTGSVGKKIKSSSGWKNEGNGDNSSGFFALPGGKLQSKIPEGFWDLGERAYFWSATLGSEFDSWARSLDWYVDGVSRERYNSNGGLSIRCLRDGSSVNTSPIARFAINMLFGTISTNFQFDASGSSDLETYPDDLEVRWDWNGDGTWDTGLERKKTNSYKFPSPGTYSVILEVKDGSDYMDTENKFLTVADGIFTDSRDGCEYPYKTIGDQTWMIKNLAYLPSISQPSMGSFDSPHYYVNGYKGSSISEAKATDNYSLLGVLYNWSAAISACPSGWHLPKDEEWSVLVNYLGAYPAGKMKEEGTAHWKSPNYGATNESGFTALPVGLRGTSGGFNPNGNVIYFWSPTELNYFQARYWVMYVNDYKYVYREVDQKEYGFSVRCLRD